MSNDRPKGSDGKSQKQLNREFENLRKKPAPSYESVLGPSGSSAHEDALDAKKRPLTTTTTASQETPDYGRDRKDLAELDLSKKESKKAENLAVAINAKKIDYKNVITRLGKKATWKVKMNALFNKYLPNRFLSLFSNRKHTTEIKELQKILSQCNDQEPVKFWKALQDIKNSKVNTVNPTGDFRAVIEVAIDTVEEVIRSAPQSLTILRARHDTSTDIGLRLFELAKGHESIQNLIKAAPNDPYYNTDYEKKSEDKSTKALKS